MRGKWAARDLWLWRSRLITEWVESIPSQKYVPVIVRRLSESHYSYNRKSTNFWKNLVSSGLSGPQVLASACGTFKLLAPILKLFNSSESLRNSSFLSRKHYTDTNLSAYQHLLLQPHWNDLLNQMSLFRDDSEFFTGSEYVRILNNFIWYLHTTRRLKESYHSEFITVPRKRFLKNKKSLCKLSPVHRV